MDEASRFLTQGVTEREWFDSVKLEVIKMDGEQEMFHMRILYLDLFSPLTTNVEPQMEGLDEPEFRLFRV